MTKLLPCPFCGGENLIQSVNGGWVPRHVEIYEKYCTVCEIYCEDCGASIEGWAASDILSNLYDIAVNEAILAWNKRDGERKENE